jgi:hypothetical protein
VKPQNPEATQHIPPVLHSARSLGNKKGISVCEKFSSIDIEAEKKDFLLINCSLSENYYRH